MHYILVNKIIRKVLALFMMLPVPVTVRCTAGLGKPSTWQAIVSDILFVLVSFVILT